MTSATFNPRCHLVNRPDSRGFSLIEILVVLSLIAILMGIGFRGMSGFKTGKSLSNVRTEAALFIENTRTMAVNSGFSRKLKFDSGTQTYWVEDSAANVKSDVRKFESGVTCVSCPSEIVFLPRGSVEDNTLHTYTFQSASTGKQMVLKVHPQTGRVEKV